VRFLYIYIGVSMFVGLLAASRFARVSRSSQYIWFSVFSCLFSSLVSRVFVSLAAFSTRDKSPVLLAVAGSALSCRSSAALGLGSFFVEPATNTNTSHTHHHNAPKNFLFRVAFKP
jgi:ABC-type Fe3+-siderophore transport system permease subunit